MLIIPQEFFSFSSVIEVIKGKSSRKTLTCYGKILI